MRLADFILSNLKHILTEWESYARTLEPAAGSMTPKELRNHAALMLEAIAEDLRTEQSPEQQKAKAHGQEPKKEHDTGGDHGLARLESSFTIEQLVSEFRALRSSVIRLWLQSHALPHITDVQDIVRFDEAIDQLLAASVFSFARKARQAEEQEKHRRNQFLAMLAHELRNPLSPISTSASILKRARGNEAVIENVSNIIARQVTHMASLVDDLLDVSRVTRGLIKVELEPMNVCQLVTDAIEQVTPQIEARHHEIAVSGMTEPVYIMADKNRLVQVVANLLSNAAKYTPTGGAIQVSTMRYHDRVAIMVADNGIGMAAEFVPHAFDLFAQAEQTSDRSSGGLGLGLALVKNLVELHRGTVTCSSAGLGKGSVFTVWLPLYHGAGHKIERHESTLG